MDLYIVHNQQHDEIYGLVLEIGHALGEQGFDQPGIECLDLWDIPKTLKLTVSDPDAALYLRVRFDALLESEWERRMADHAEHLRQMLACWQTVTAVQAAAMRATLPPDVLGD